MVLLNIIEKCYDINKVKNNCLVDFLLPSFGEHVCSYTCASLLFVEVTLKPDPLTIIPHRKM